MSLYDISNNEPTDTANAEETIFTYIKDNNDLTDYAIDFKHNETHHYNNIQSYTEDKVSLFICVNGIVSAGGYYESDGTLQEYIRSNDSSEKKFTSIQEWYNDFCGEAATIDKVLNEVFIGEDLVPLWKVLVDEMEEDWAEEQDNIELESHLPMSNCNSIIVYSFLALNLLSVLGCIIVSLI